MAEFTSHFQCLFSIFDRSLPLRQKKGIQKKNPYFRAEGSSHESAGQWLFMQRCRAKGQVWKITNFQFASCEYPPYIDFYSCSADFIDQTHGTCPVVTAQMVEMKTETA